VGWLLSWHFTSVTDAEQNGYGCCIKAGVVDTSDAYVVFCRNLNLAGIGLVAWLVLVRS
jgi:hypothetical protein